ncbi:MAG: 2-methylaconitate cis-trans isomerase PrpF [Burkholderiales bacterium]|nr:2-methylaconitate cis-trans isomerase PrpF [Burkholderiales bacterium]
MSIQRLPAEWWRGGTSKGLFVLRDDLHADAAEGEALLLRAIGSPDPYGKQIDGLGGATSSTSKVVIVARSDRPDCDVEYRFGAVAIDRPVIDWSGNCGNLTTAVGPFALLAGLVPPQDGTTTVRLWQENLGKRILAHVPMRDGMPLETGEFTMDGVAFPGAEIVLEFLDPGGADGAMLPTGDVVDRLAVPDVGTLDATLISAGNPTVFIDAAALGLDGTELQPRINGDTALLARCEAIRAAGAVAMGLASDPASATRDRPATPKLSFVAPPRAFTASSGRFVPADAVDLVARILSMGALHHAYTGTGAVALSVAAALPGSVVQRAVRPGVTHVRVGHASGVMTVGAEVRQDGSLWLVDRSVMSRSARRLMGGTVFVPR